MLDLRPSCECCDKDLPPDSTEARICSFECTFCQDCATRILSNKCPNCAGELLPRPRRPADKLANRPPSANRIFNPDCLKPDDRPRDDQIEANPDIMGGTPVLRGTRMTVYAVLGRLEGGDRIDDILTDNPHLTRESIETAALYARTHPFVGRPGGRPWAKAA